MDRQVFFNVWPSEGGHLFWPPSMVYISVIIADILQITIFHMLDLCGSFHVLNILQNVQLMYCDLRLWRFVLLEYTKNPFKPHSNVFPSFTTRENPGFVVLSFFTHVEGEKMKCEVILPRNKLRGRTTEYCFYQALCKNCYLQFFQNFFYVSGIL